LRPANYKVQPQVMNEEGKQQQQQCNFNDENWTIWQKRAWSSNLPLKLDFFCLSFGAAAVVPAQKEREKTKPIISRLMIRQFPSGDDFKMHSICWRGINFINFLCGFMTSTFDDYSIQLMPFLIDVVEYPQ
jgi:hypothetical protein